MLSFSLSLNVCVNFNSFACSIHLSTFTSKTDVFRSGPSFTLFASLICSCSFFMQMLFHEAFSFYSTMSTKWMIAWPKIYLFQIIMLQSANLFGFLLSINCNHISARIVTSTHSWRAFFFSLNICNCTWNMYGNLFSVVFSIFAIHQITPTIECKVSVCASLFNSIWICIFAIFDCYAKCVFQWVCEGVGEGKTGKSRIWITWEGSTWGDAIVIAKVEMSELENNSQYSDAFVSLVYF